MRGLIEDEDGAPYPPCKNCPDQVAPPAPPGEGRPDWAHIYADPDGGPGRWYLYNCQRPNKGRYGTLENRAEPDMDNATNYEEPEEQSK